MRQDGDAWSKTVYRVRGIPNGVKTFKDTILLLCLGLGDVPSDNIRVYSLATTLLPFENPPSKVATMMFQTLLSLAHYSVGKDQWRIPIKGRSDVDSLTLDTHFKAMTPLNDVESIHLFDCIAISGLASHPFGSWQPKGGDKTFMWIRDALPKHIPGVRAVIYGYDTKLDCSSSNQRIPDLAQAFIHQLLSNGWNLQSGKKPIAFLAHSLGGLVLKEAMVQLANSPDAGFKGVLGLLRGAVFFGVPNLGMEQSDFLVHVQNNQNRVLIEDIARGSNYLRELDDSFKETSLHSELKFFWAFETSESPTIRKNSDGTTDRNGKPTVLVSKDSATCGTQISSITLPINETHSDMVKFTKDSEYYHVVVSKLITIMEPQSSTRQNIYHNTRSMSQSILDSNRDGNAPAGNTLPSANTESKAWENKSRVDLKTELEVFQRGTGLTDTEKADFKATSFASLRDFILSLQTEQERTGSMRYMKRLEPFLNCMKEYVEVVEVAEVFVDISDAICYLWGPMKYILHFAEKFLEAFDSVLDAYQKLGQQMLAYSSFEELFKSKPHMRDVLVMVYKDILGFHKDAIRHFKQSYWMQFFEASWRAFAPSIDHIERNLQRYRLLIMSGASITEFEGAQNHRQSAISAFEKQMKDQEVLRRETVEAWLCHFDCAAQQESHRDTRSICTDPGRWLLNHPQFQEWYSPEYCSNHFLWLNGIPGAGKTILASVVVDKAFHVQNSTIAFFYCKHDDDSRNSFLAVARSILAQVLYQNPHFLPYFHESASKSTALSSPKVAEEMLRTILKSCGRTYVIIDGVDECAAKERKRISSCFLSIAEIRCLFVSQDDGIAGKTLGDLPTIRITTENKEDLKDFSAVYHKKLEASFGELRSDYHIANIISARARGMFIFAEVLAKYLEAQQTRAALLEELHPDKLPIKLDEVYDRILNRICQSKSDNLSERVRLVLGWIVCAKRPLRWSEIQGAISINVDQQNVNYDEMLIGTPKDLFGSLVELDLDGTVQLIHATAREYLTRTNFVQPLETSYSLSMLTLAYLAFPQVDKGLSDDTIEADLISGTHAFYDYASACWAIHLETGIECSDSVHKLLPLLETLEAFIPLHLASTPKSLPISKKVQDHLSPIKASELYHEVAQAVEWSKKQFGPHSQCPSQDEALDLWQVTDKIRSVLEGMHHRRVSHSLPEADALKLDRFYGSNWFKCTRVSCHYYHQGFNSPGQRKNHVDRHDRPFLCVFDGCQVKLFGCSTKDELRKHVFDWHGIDVSDDRELAEFPKPPKPQRTSTAKNPASFQCHICPNKYTAKHNLQSHLRTHTGTKDFECRVCGQSFTRKHDCNRHEQGHGDKKFACFGKLKDGSPWGCESSFARADKLADHFKSKTGQHCIRPFILQSLQDNSEGSSTESMLSDPSGTNAVALLAAGELLPSFGEFLKLCGIDKSVLTSETTGSSLPSGYQSSGKNE